MHDDPFTAPADFERPLPRAVIDAEKAGKPRPDLMPARAALAIKRTELTRARAYTTSSDHVLAADTCLREFVISRDVDDLAQAGAHVCVAIALDEVPGGDAYAHAMMRAGEVMGYGLRKHGRCTWRVAGTEQADPQTHYASAVRHVLEYLVDPQAREAGSGFPVLWHALSQIGITIDLLLDPPCMEGENDGHVMVVPAGAP